MAKTTDTLTAIAWAIFTAVVLGWLIVKRDGNGDTLDEVGDFLVDLTTSEQSRLDALEPETRSMVLQLRERLAQGDQPINVYVGQTLRTPAQEKAAIDAGRSGVKTHSWHELGRAVDLYPVNPDTGKPDTDGLRVDLFQVMHTAARDLGFVGLAFTADGEKRLIHNASGKLIWDGGHLEWHGPYSTIADAVAAEGAAYGIS